MRIKDIFSRCRNTIKVPESVYYNKQLRDSFSTCSVCGGSLHGKTSVITGGYSGIGFAIAQRLLDEGSNVIITGRSEEKLLSASKELRKSKDCFIDILLIDQLDVNSVIKGCETAFNKYDVDFWINCAGIITEMDRKRRFIGTQLDQYLKVMNTNFKSISIACKEAYLFMKKRNGGHIINIASMAGIIPSFGYTAYGISKCAVINLTRSYFKDCESNVNVTAIAPGIVVTRMGNLKFGDNIANTYTVSRHTTIPEEIAALVAFILSPVGKYLNGETLEACSNENLF